MSVRALYAAAALLLAGGVILDAWLDTAPAPGAAPDLEPTADRAAAVRAAFATPADPAPAADGLADFFVRAGRVARTRDPVGAVDLFDADRLYEEIRAAAGPDALPGAKREAVGRLYAAVGRAFAGGWTGAGWDATDICRVDAQPGGRDMIVYARHRRAGDTTGGVPARWWLARRDGEYQAYDFEDCRVGLRLTDQLAGLVGQPLDPAGHAAAADALRGLGLAAEACAANDPARAEAALAPTRSAPLPPATRAVVHLADAAVALQRDDPTAALAHVQAADRLRPGMVGAELVKAVAYYRRGEWGPAADAARAYTAALGPDPRAEMVLAEAERQLAKSRMR